MRLNRKISENEIKQKFNLKKLLGYSPNDRQKQFFYDLAVNKMVRRTSEGNDVNNQKFPEYNQDYADEKGVIASSVDLILTGNMLNSFEQGDGKNSVEISIRDDQTGKAHGNITGSYGKPKGNKAKARDFFGFKDSDELKDVVSQVDLLKTEEAPRFNASDLRDSLENISLIFEGFDG